ncbi:GspH/FimT family pseudopilin [Pseudohaliea rubra]|uniref:Type II secretion system protein H n=1 Tax=Pseudohaliea rubra DSM 19751 TaxID=1265313 RepID=A0A095VS09_9GAMM|nr:GspH/FimT family pseudopilin [Pseudohaliea rubra]KGE04140.1 Type IV fimbrial biogenesis protein FimT [Pseudohaliea rubra DSM 19751]
MVNRSRGFTLVELMITIVVLGILIGLAAPAFRGFVAEQRIRAASMDLQMALTMARSEAVKRNARIELQRSNGTDWSGGWRVPDPNDVTLLTYTPVVDVAVEGPDSDIVFRPSGRPLSGVSFRLSVAGLASATPSCITLDSSGRATGGQGSCP